MVRLIFMGGNGHCEGRLAAAKEAGAAVGLVANSLPYPGFEHRPRAASFDEFLDRVAQAHQHMACASVEYTGLSVHNGTASSDAYTSAGDNAYTFSSVSASSAPDHITYATGIGGLLFLCLRARGHLQSERAIFQAPVLWGLEHRLMPKFMRLGFAQLLLARAFRSGLFQRRFVKKHFLSPPDETTVETFFSGYTSCAALPDFFAWLTPALLRSLERSFAENPSLFENIQFLWGERDSVVPLADLHFTEQALGVHFPVSVIANWGHYPMIDDPESWVREVLRVASAAPVS
ncbi:MAG: alpha/beta hydrolase [Polyangiaceae bacterium]|nr:alpha/beta hydrolase [Polyangiaceae bacterium]